MPVRVEVDDWGRPWALHCRTNGSGDFTALAGTDGFVELPPGPNTYAKGFAPLDILSAHRAPQDNIELRVTATGTIKGRVVSAQGKPDPAAQIAIYPEGGSKPGTGRWWIT